MFEGRKYKAPNNIDKYLADKYGPNFMDIPKAADRRTHASKI
jgi:phosphorylcholine metabolism protein LicD